MLFVKTFLFKVKYGYCVDFTSVLLIYQITALSMFFNNDKGLYFSILWHNTYIIIGDSSMHKNPCTFAELFSFRRSTSCEWQ